MLSLLLIALTFGQPSKKWVSISPDDRKISLDTSSIRKIGAGTYRMAIRWDLGSIVMVYTDEVACDRWWVRRIKTDYGSEVEWERPPSFEKIPGALLTIYANACGIAARKIPGNANGRGERR